MRSSLPSFSDALQGARSNPHDLAELSLCMAREVSYPDLDVEGTLLRLDSMAARFESRTGVVIEVDRIRDLSGWFAGELRFRGNDTNYYSLENSFLNDVLNERTGIPITLSIVYQALAWRIGLPMLGICSPAHFLLRTASSAAPELFVDPFNGGRILTRSEAEGFLQELTGLEELDDDALRPATADAVIYRCLNNIKPLLLRQKEWERVATVKRLQCLLLTSGPEDWLERATMEIVLKRPRRAAEYLTRSFALGLPRSMERELRAVRDRVLEDHALLQ